MKQRDIPKWLRELYPDAEWLRCWHGAPHVDHVRVGRLTGTSWRDPDRLICRCGEAPLLSDWQQHWALNGQ